MDNRQIIFKNHPVKSSEKLMRDFPAQVCYTNDKLTAQLVFEISDCTEAELAGLTASIMIFMKDGSFFQDSAVIDAPNKKITYVMLENQVAHAGDARASLALTGGSKGWGGPDRNFTVISDLGQRVATEVMIKDWTMLTAEARAYLDDAQAAEAARAATFGQWADTQADWAAAEAARINDFSSKASTTYVDAQLAEKVQIQKYNDARLAAIGGSITTYATLSALQTAFPNGNANVCKVTADNKWYYWSGTEWTVGGTYQATGVANDSITTKAIKDDAITPYKMRDVEYQLETFVPINIYDKNALSVQGEFASTNNGTFTTNQYTISYHHTDYLPVRPNIRYIRKFQLSFVFYDANKAFISGVSSPSAMALNGITGYGVTTPANCAYMIINVDTTQKDDEFLYMAEEDLADPTQYKLDIPKLNLNFLQMLKGKKGVCFGDSITEMGTYPQQIGSLTGATVANVGFGGTRLVTHSDTGDYNAFCMTKLATAITTGVWTEQEVSANAIGKAFPTILARLKAIKWSEIEFITMLYGTNDFTSYGVTLGELASTNTGQIYGALNHIIQAIITAYPHIKIYLLTPIFRQTIPNRTGDSDQYPSGAGQNTLWLYDIANAIEAKGKEYHVPCKNLYYTSGINRYNQVIYLEDGVHLTAKGYTLLAERIARFLLSN